MYESNVYYNPEKSGLKIFGSISEENLCYEFNDLIVLQDKESKKLFWAADSGCSCPTPFETYYFRSAKDNNLQVINKTNYRNFEATVNNFPAAASGRNKLLNKVRKYLEIK